MAGERDDRPPPDRNQAHSRPPRPDLEQMRKEYEETGARTTAALMDEYIKSAHEARSYKQALLMLVEDGAKTTPGPAAERTSPS